MVHILLVDTKLRSLCVKFCILRKMLKTDLQNFINFLHQETNIFTFASLFVPQSSTYCTLYMLVVFFGYYQITQYFALFVAICEDENLDVADLAC